MNKLIPCLLAILVPTSLLAQVQDEAPEAPELRRYTVEVIIFRYAEDVASGSELFLPDAPEQPDGDDPFASPDDDGLAVMPAEPLALPPEPEPLPDAELVLLQQDEYQLDGVLERLERLDAYDPLMHFGWTQATWPEDQTEPIPLHRFARPPTGLDGNLTLYLSRFLHLVVDLELADPTRAVGEAPVWFRIHENRILRNGELRYYDHPKFGLLARVTRVEEEEDADDGELLGYPVQ